MLEKTWQENGIYLFVYPGKLRVWFDVLVSMWQKQNLCKFFILIMIIQLAKGEFTDWSVHQHALVMYSIPPLSAESNTAFSFNALEISSGSSRSSFESDVPGDNRVYCFMNPYISSKGKATVKALWGNGILLWGQSWNFREKGMLYWLNFCTVNEMGIGWMSYREMKL